MAEATATALRGCQRQRYSHQWRESDANPAPPASESADTRALASLTHSLTHSLAADTKGATRLETAGSGQSSHAPAVSRVGRGLICSKQGAVLGRGGGGHAGLEHFPEWGEASGAGGYGGRGECRGGGGGTGTG